MMNENKIRFRWYKSDDLRYWIVDEVLGIQLGCCGSESVVERLCEKLNLLEQDIVFQ